MMDSSDMWALEETLDNRDVLVNMECLVIMEIKASKVQLVLQLKMVKLAIMELLERKERG